MNPAKPYILHNGCTMDELRNIHKIDVQYNVDNEYLVKIRAWFLLIPYYFRNNLYLISKPSWALIKFSPFSASYIFHK